MNTNEHDVSVRLLLIDNYDSFTYNLYQYLSELGAEVQVVRNDKMSIDEVVAGGFDGVVISPGPCTPDEAGISLEVLARLSGLVPIFGVCLGHQSIVQSFGGTIIRASAPVHGKSSVVEHTGHKMFAGVPEAFEAGRYHSLIAEPASFPDEALEITARFEDIIMAVAHREHATWGVQFHPESILTADGKQMLRNFVAVCVEQAQ